MLRFPGPVPICNITCITPQYGSMLPTDIGHSTSLSRLAPPSTLLALQGKVSILAHSLGSVLCYEILCNQPHLFDHLEFTTHGTHTPSDTSKAAISFHKTQQSSASEAQQQQQPWQQQQHHHRQASTEIAFAPMSSRDLDVSGQAARSCPDFPMPLAKPQPHTAASLGRAAGRKENAQVRLVVWFQAQRPWRLSHKSVPAQMLAVPTEHCFGKTPQLYMVSPRESSSASIGFQMQAAKFCQFQSCCNNCTCQCIGFDSVTPPSCCRSPSLRQRMRD